MPTRRNVLKTAAAAIAGAVVSNISHFQGKAQQMTQTPDVLDDLLTLNGKPITTQEEWNKKRDDIKKRFLDTLGEFPKEIPPLESQTLEDKVVGTYVRQKVSYNVHPDERVTAYLLLPGRIHKPNHAVLCLQQTTEFAKDEPAGLGGDSQYHYALHLVERGYICLVPDHLASGERKPKNGNHFDTSEFYQRFPNWSAVGKAIWDGQRALDFLFSYGSVDRQRIGCIGHSLGGHGAVFLACIDERVKCAVSSCGLVTFAHNAKKLNWARDDWYSYIPKLRPLFLKDEKAPFDFHELCALIAPRPFLNISAYNDEIYDVANMDDIAELGLKVDKAYRFLKHEDKFGNYMLGNGHGFPPEARVLASSGLDRWIGR
jgi:dienelactone hydrolase